MNRRLQYLVVATSSAIVGLLLFGTTVRSATPDDTPYTQLAVFGDVFSKIKQEYVEEPDLKAVGLGAVNGLLESLDPFASYLTADQFKKYQAEHGKGKADVGLLISRGPGYLRIVDAVPGSPAAKAGLTTNDVIESINKISTRDMPLAYAELLLQGDPGSAVDVSALTAKQTDPIDMKLTRSAITYPAVTGKMMMDKSGQSVGVITVATLVDGRAKEVGQRARDLEKQGAKRLILDLRYCGIGSIDEGISTANLFMDSGLITFAKGQKITRTDSTASASNAVTKLPLTVLANRGTAGAAEVAAAALKESKRATLVGETTFGDAAIRRPVTLADGSAVILAVAKYYGPDGKAIQDDKVAPTVTVAQFDVNSDDVSKGGKPATPSDPILEQGLNPVAAAPANQKAAAPDPKKQTK